MGFCSPRSTVCRGRSVEGMLGLAIGFAPMLLMLLLGGYHYRRVALLTAQFGEWLRDKGSLGMLIYLIAFTFYLVMCGPSTPLELVGGFVYPLAWAILLNGAAKLCGSVLCFLIARRFGACARQLMSGGSTEAAAGGSLPPALAMIDSMLVTHEFRALVLFRFAVLPFSVKNYGLGAMPSVRLYSFAVTCALGDFPFTVAFAYAGRKSMCARVCLCLCVCVPVHHLHWAAWHSLSCAPFHRNQRCRSGTTRYDGPRRAKCVDEPLRELPSE